MCIVHTLLYKHISKIPNVYSSNVTREDFMDGFNCWINCLLQALMAYASAGDDESEDVKSVFESFPSENIKTDLFAGILG